MLASLLDLGAPLDMVVMYIYLCKTHIDLKVSLETVRKRGEWDLEHVEHRCLRWKHLGHQKWSNSQMLWLYS